MNWCITCQDYYEPHATDAACPTCGGALAIADDGEPAVDGYAVNAGNWNVTDFGWVVGACHTPDFDALMTRLRLLERAVQEDEPRIRRLPRPWLGDPHHNQLKRERDAVRNRAKAYLLAHRGLIILDSR